MSMSLPLYWRTCRLRDDYFQFSRICFTLCSEPRNLCWNCNRPK
jgi:hypothetical protein